MPARKTVVLAGFEVPLITETAGFARITVAVSLEKENRIAASIWSTLRLSGDCVATVKDSNIAFYRPAAVIEAARIWSGAEL